jgi:hypothetical protein
MTFVCYCCEYADYEKVQDEGRVVNEVDSPAPDVLHQEPRNGSPDKGNDSDSGSQFCRHHLLSY